MTYSAMDRFRDAINGSPKDRVPIFPMISGWAAEHFSDAPLSEMAWNPGLIVKTHIKAREAVGHDAFFAYSDPSYVADAFGCKVHYRPTGPISEPSSFPVSSIDEIENIPMPDPERDRRLPIMLEVVRQLNSYGKGEIPVLGSFAGAFTTTCRIFEPDIILRMIYKNPEILEVLLDRVNGFLLDFGRALINAGANLLFLPEPSASSSLISPTMFRRFVLPRLQHLGDRLKAQCILHICGDSTPILNLMADTGIKILSLDQCMDLRESRKLVPEAVLGGNVDPIDSLLMGTREKVASDTVHCLQASGTSRFILMSGCGVPPATPVENLKTMVETAKAYGLGQ